MMRMMRMMYPLLVLFSLSLPAIKEASSACQDGNLCDYWASAHRCILSPESMLQSCPAVCGNPCVCDLSGSTEDTACDCLIKAKTGYCDTSDATVDCKTTCTKVKTIECPTLSPPNDANAVYTTTATHYLSDVFEKCREGYNSVNAVNMGRVVCTESGSWYKDINVGRPVECQIVDCGNPPSNSNTTLQVLEGTTYKNNASYSCQAGYKYVSGDTKLTCEEDSMWHGQMLKCEDSEQDLDSLDAFLNAIGVYLDNLKQQEIKCGAPPTAEGAVLANVSGNAYHDTAEYKCAPGWEYLSGHTTLTCETTSKWDGTMIVCSRIECGDVPTSDLTTASYTTTNFESAAVYSCVLGHERVGGSFVRTCSANGTWTGDPLVCLPVACGSAPVYAGARQWSLDGRSFNDPAPYLYQSKVYYECYYQENEAERKKQWVLTCGPYKSWEGEPPQCGANSEFKRDDFDPEPSEAPGSWALGLIIFSVLIFFIVVFIIMDIDTMRKHIRYMKANVRNFRRGIKNQWKKLRSRRQVQTTSLSDIQVKEQSSPDANADGAPRKRALGVIHNLSIPDDESIFGIESEPSTPKTMTSFV